MTKNVSVDDSTQVGCEDKMSSRRERKSLSNVFEAPKKVCEDEAVSDFEDDYYDSEVVYTEDNDKDDDWEEASFKDYQERINLDEEEYYRRDNEEWTRAKALPSKVQIFSSNKMENKRSVDDSTQVGCEVMSSQREEEEYTWEDHKMSFYLEEDQDYEIEAVGEWRENSDGEMIGYADIYYIHPVTRLRCKSVRDCLVGWSEPNEEVTKKWETLCQLIETLENLDEIILTASVVGLSKNVETGVGVSPTPENEEYEKAMCKECKKMEGKEYKEQTTQYRPENKEEIHISHAMCTYTVSFYTIGKQAIFEYSDNDGIQSYEVDRVDFLSWLTDEEEKKVLRFECKMREKHIKRMESKERERVRKACAWKDRDNKLKTFIKKEQALWRRKVRAHNQRERAGVSNACA